MFTWTTKASPPAQLGAATPLLTHLTGAFAARIAGLWGPPHAVFVTASAERRHLVCLALTQAPLSLELADGLLHWPLRRAIKVALPGAPEGLARALGVMGETAWSGDDYGRLLQVLAQPEAAKRLRHAAALTPAQVLGLALTPVPLLRAGIAKLALSPEVMDPIREAWEIIAARDRPGRLEAVAARWGAAADLSKLRTAIEEDLIPPLPASPLPTSADLRALTTAAEMRDVAGRYRNCLAGQVDSAAEGASLFFEWLPAPGAVVEVRKDVLRGWVLAQAKLSGNETVPEAQRAAITEALEAIGVHVGRPTWALDRALDQGLLWNQTPHATADHVADCFTD